jgi:hypothetical protein
MAVLSKPNRGIALLLAVGLAALPFTGCGGSGRVSVSGRVTVDGKPVPEGSITFIPEKGNPGPTAGGAIRDGSYKIDARKGPMTGKHRMEVHAVARTGRSIPDPRSPGKADVKVDETKDIVPAKYLTGKAGDLPTCDLHAGANTVDVELKSK